MTTGRRLKLALSLRAWTILLALTCTLPLLVALALAMRLEAERQRDIQTLRLREIAESVAARIGGRVDLAFGLLLVTDGELASPRSIVGALPTLRRLLQSQQLVDALIVMGPDGRRMLEINRGGAVGDLEGLAACAGGPLRTGPAVREVRMLHREGSGEAAWQGQLRFVPAAGACSTAALVSMATLGRRLRQQHWSADWVGSLVGSDFRILARSTEPERFVGQLSTAPLRDAIASGQPRAFEGITPDGVAVLAYTMPLNSAPGWHIAVGVARSTLDAPISRSSWWLLVAGCILAFGACIVGLFLTRALSHAIRTLARTPENAARLQVVEVDEARNTLVLARQELTAAGLHQERMIAALRDLQGRLLQAQEAERLQLSRELHDELGQELALLHMLLQQASGNPAGDSLASAHALVDRLVERVRMIARDLRPPQLEHLGLAAALRSLLRRAADTMPLKLDLDIPQEAPRLAPMIETALFRVTQAAVTNVLRHSGARTVSVSLRIADGSARLEIRDDGAGFDVQESSGGIGLAVMRERVGALGGTLEISSTAARGTSIIAVVPCVPQLP